METLYHVWSSDGRLVINVFAVDANEAEAFAVNHMAMKVGAVRPCLDQSQHPRIS